MKKIFFLAMMLTIGLAAKAADCQDGPYGLQINGTKVVDAPKFGEPDIQGRIQYKAGCVELAAGDVVKLINQSCDATWMVDLDPYGDYANFTGGKDANQLTCNVAGKYDFYIKLSAEVGDLVYVELGKSCGDNPGGGGDQPGGGDDDVNYYAMGWINGADHGDAAHDVYEDELMFNDGKLTINCTMGSYIGIKDHTGNFYRSKVETTIQDTKVTLDWQDGTWENGRAWAIPEGVNYIIMRSVKWKGQIVLERVDKATYDAYHLGGNQAIENTKVSEKARKVIIDGQLRIVRGDKIFDTTGRQL